MHSLKFRKLIYFFLCAFLAVSCLVLPGCSEIRLANPLADDVIIKVNNEETSVSEAIFSLMQVKNDYRSDEDEIFWYRSIGDITFEEYIKASVRNEIETITASVALADEMYISLSDSEKAAIRENATSAFNTISSVFDVEKYGISVEIVANLYTKKALYEKVFAKASENLNFEISDTDTKVIMVNYVEIPAEVSVNQAEMLCDEINSGTSFETACRTFGWEPELRKIIKPGEMPAQFEITAYSLGTGELSPVIEAENCKYVILCLEDYMISESAANKNKVLSEARQAAFEKIYTDFAKRSIIRFNDKIWDSIVVADLN